MHFDEVVQKWQEADPKAIHPLRDVSEAAYWDSGNEQALLLSSVFPTGSDLIDFGCGDGRVAKPMTSLGYSVVGVDSNQAFLAQLPRSIRPVHCDGTGLREEVGEDADGLYCLAVLIHHSYESGHALINEFAIAVRPGGLLVLDWPTAAPGVPAYERRAYNEITTWAHGWQETVAREVGLNKLETKLPWSVYEVL